MDKNYRTKKRTKRFALRLLALSLLCGACLFPATPAHAEETKLESVMGRMTIWEWHRAYDDDTTYKDANGNDVRILPRSKSDDWVRALIVWDYNGTNYFCSGNTIQKLDVWKESWEGIGKTTHRLITSNRKVSEERLFDISSDSFMTLKGRNTPYIKYSGSNDSDNGYAPMYQIQVSTDYDSNSGYYLYDWNGFYLTTDEDDEDDVKEYSSRYWTFRDSTTGPPNEYEKKDKYGFEKEKDKGLFKIFYNESGGWDGGWTVSENGYLHSYNNSAWGGYYKFKIFIGRQREILAISDDFTLAPGQVVRIADNVALKDGKKIILSEGSVLSIAGKFINNGTIINNGGTIILKEDARIQPLDPYNDTSGSIECKNGDIVLMKNSRIICADKASLKLDNYSTCVMDKDSILAVCGDFRVENASFIDNRGGYIFSNYYCSNPSTFYAATNHGSYMSTLTAYTNTEKGLTVASSGRILNDGGSLMIRGTTSVSGGGDIITINGGTTQFRYRSGYTAPSSMIDYSFWPGSDSRTN